MECGFSYWSVFELGNSMAREQYFITQYIWLCIIYDIAWVRHQRSSTKEIEASPLNVEKKLWSKQWSEYICYIIFERERSREFDESIKTRYGHKTNCLFVLFSSRFHNARCVIQSCRFVDCTVSAQFETQPTIRTGVVGYWTLTHRTVQLNGF